jgi:hypothetical protein
MSVLPPSPAKLNRLYQDFWKAEDNNVKRRLADPLIMALAMEDMASEMARSVPLYSQKSMESALAKAEKIRNRVRSEDGRRGGRPRRSDALQGLIVEIVARRPGIRASDLFDRLRNQEIGGIIEDVEDDKIHFRHSEHDSRSAPISGLKDRLARARKSVMARKPVSAKA